MTMQHTLHKTIKDKTMNDKELTYGDFLQRLDIRDLLLDAGYRQNRRFGLRLPSFVRTDSEGRRIRGDQIHHNAAGKMLFTTAPTEGIQCCFVHQGAPAALCGVPRGYRPEPAGEPRVQPPC